MLKGYKFSPFAHSIFLRIYAGLVVVCICIGIIAYLLVGIVNDFRSQNYREEMASSAFYLIKQGILRQGQPEAIQNWLDDASILLNIPLSILPAEKITFSRMEQERLKAGDAVVRFDSAKNFADIYSELPTTPAAEQEKAGPPRLLYARVDRIGEQQIKALAVFILDDLVQYRGQEEARLATLQRHFSYPLKLRPASQMDLDVDQRARFRRNEVVLVIRDGANGMGSSLQVVSPTSHPGEALVLGPIPTFNWMPLQLLLSIIVLGLIMLSLAVYSLIFPVERKLRALKVGIGRVRAGDLNARVNVTGHDEVALVGEAFNNMTAHVQRLIDSQRELTRAVSHELRTPVARIRFGVDMLADTDDSESRWEQQALIDKDIESLNELIDEILTYAKLEEGTPSLSMEPIALGALIGKVGEETRRLSTKSIEVVLPPIEIEAVAEQRYLHRVVQNLAGNAVRYADSRVRISTGLEQGMAFISVEDDGPGIPEKDREKVFMPFTRLDDSRTRASGGYGLGLSIVSRIAFWFGGTIRVDASPELGGARFTMRWPIKPKKL